MTHTQTLIWLHVYYALRDPTSRAAKKWAQNPKQTYRKLSAGGIIRGITKCIQCKIIRYSYIRGTPVVALFIVASNNAIYRQQALNTNYTQKLHNTFMHRNTRIISWICYLMLTYRFYLLLCPIITEQES